MLDSSMFESNGSTGVEKTGYKKITTLWKSLTNSPLSPFLKQFPWLFFDTCFQYYPLQDPWNLFGLQKHFLAVAFGQEKMNMLLYFIEDSTNFIRNKLKSMIANYGFWSYPLQGYLGGIQRTILEVSQGLSWRYPNMVFGVFQCK